MPALPDSGRKQREMIARTVTVLALVAAGALLGWFVWSVLDVLLLILISAILAAGFAPLVGFVERCEIRGIRVSRGVAIFILYLAIFGAVALLLSTIVLPAVGETGRFVARLPAALAHIRAWLVALQRHHAWMPNTVRLYDQFVAEVLSFGRFTPNVTAAYTFFTQVGAVVTVLVLTYYMLLEGAQMRRAFLSLFPMEWRPRVDGVLRRIGLQFGGWLRGQLLLSFLIAVPVAIGLFLIGMPFPFLLGIIAGVGELIPIVGPTIGAAVAVFVALSQPLWQLLAVIGLYLVIMNVEPHILVPRIMQHALGLSPVLTIVALLTGIRLGGILGGLLAIPAAAAVQVIAHEVAVEIRGGQPALAGMPAGGGGAGPEHPRRPGEAEEERGAPPAAPAGSQRVEVAESRRLLRSAAER
jgi:predicted PurR-regulated permease PerM